MFERPLYGALSWHVVSCGLVSAVLWAQTSTSPPDNELQHIRTLAKQAGQELHKFRDEGGKSGDPGDPARRWAAVLWTYREQHPRTPAATQATRAAIHLLQLANQDRDVIARAEMLPADEPAWDSVINDFRASARKSGQYERFIPYTRSLLDRMRDSRIRANVRLHLGRAYLDRGESAEAQAAFEAVMEDAPGSGLAKTAERYLSELTALAIGKPAPPFEARTIDGSTIRSADLAGKVVLLNFWATW